jgi:multidrug efflux pump subunit AcrB
MWIVKLALRRPYTFVVLSLLALLLGIGTSVEAPKDIYPYIGIPVVTIVWSYSGLPPQEMEGRIVTVCERALTTTVNDIEHMQSESYEGVAIIRVFFQPSVKVELAMSQITAVVQTILRVLPPGTFPPNILKYDASNVPILQLGLSGQGIQQQLLQAEIDKFAVGASTNFMIVQDEAYLAQARSSEVAARSDWMKALLSLQRARG